MFWYAKMYFSGDREIFQYDSMGTQGAPCVQQELPFLESLLSFQELDIAEQTPLLKDIADCWSRYIADDDKDALTSAMMKLGELGARHIYFQLLYVRIYERQARLAFSEDRGSAEDEQMLDELRRLYSRCIRSRCSDSLTWCWTLTLPGANRKSRRRRTIITTSRMIRACSGSTPFRSASSRWNTRSALRFCTQGALRT